MTKKWLPINQFLSHSRPAGHVTVLLVRLIYDMGNPIHIHEWLGKRAVQVNLKRGKMNCCEATKPVPYTLVS